MGRQDVFHFLRQNPEKWYTVKEMSTILGVSQSSVGRSLRVLRIRKEVEFKRNAGSGKGFVYRYSERDF